MAKTLGGGTRKTIQTNAFGNMPNNERHFAEKQCLWKTQMLGWLGLIARQVKITPALLTELKQHTILPAAHLHRPLS